MKSEDILDTEATESVIKKNGDPSEDVSDTPRTDAYTEQWNGWDVIPAEVSRQLERELALASAEVERWKAHFETVAQTVASMHKAAVGDTKGPILGVIEDVIAVRERAEQAEAACRRAIEIAERLYDVDTWTRTALYSELHALKATLNQTDK